MLWVMAFIFSLMFLAALPFAYKGYIAPTMISGLTVVAICLAQCEWTFA